MSAYCSTHAAWLPVDQFYPASLRTKESRCKACNRRQRAQRRVSSPLRRLHWHMYQAERRRRDSGGVWPTLQVAEAVWARHQGRSVIDGSSLDLCIVRFYPDLPLGLHPWNAVLVTLHQARRLPRRPGMRVASFPASLQRVMADQRLNLALLPEAG